MSVSSLNILNNMTSTSHVFVFAAFIVASAVAQPPQDLSGIGFGARSERNFPQLPNRRHPHPPPPPPFAPPSFLQNVSVEARRDFFRIEHQANLTRAQFIAAQESWAANNSVSVEYEAWLANITATINATIVQADAAVANLSSDAQALYQQLRAIRISDNLTRQEEGQLLEEVIRSANSSARHELFKALRDIPGALPPPPRGPHGHRGGFGGPQGGFGGNQGGQGGFGGPQGGFGGNQGGPGGFGGNQGGPGGFGGGFSGQPRSSTPANF